MLSWLAPLVLATSLYSCGSSDSGGDGGLGHGSACTENGDCASGDCTDQVCVGDGGLAAGSDCSSDGQCASGSCTDGQCDAGLAAGSDCSSDRECASGSCTDGQCDGSSSGGGGTTGTGGTNGTGTGQPGDDCSKASDCASALCVSGKCSSGSGTGSGASTTPGPHFSGSGSGFRPLTTGCGPDTATQCTGECEQMGGDPGVTVVRPPVTLCFAGEGDLTPDDPAVVIEQVIEELNGVAYVHIRITFDPAFVDNTYGEGACCGWSEKRGHTFNKDLTNSDHTELLLTNGDAETVMHFKIDLITADPAADCGYATQGVTGGDGLVLVGNAEDVLAASTSLDRNINGCGYCQNDACAPSGDCTVDSPATDDNYTPNAGTPNWDYRQVYEVWISLDAFGASGFGQGYITYTHASPAKGTDTLMVEPTPCPEEWDDPYCPPSVVAEGGNCFGTPDGSGGASSSGAGGAPNDTPNCPPNYQTYVTTEGASLCTPIPWGGNDMMPCPNGYHLDLASEGRYCLPD
ncbi:MAG TPA: hypothetical protein VJN18_02355 [Polyangiaceae bacterium]|nr:hypothetical protein [Polyangiaceae bacterium]